VPTVSLGPATCYPFAANIAVSAVSEAELPPWDGGLTNRAGRQIEHEREHFGRDLLVQAARPLSPRVFEGSLQNPRRLLHTDGSVLWDSQMLTFEVMRA
jgi:hypothetical protein